MSILWVLLFIVGSVNCQMTLQQFFGGSQGIVWGQVTAAGKMKVVTPIKGCFATNLVVTLTGTKVSSLVVGQIYLVGGNKSSTTIALNSNFVKQAGDLDATSKHWLATQPDLCGAKGQLCAGTKATLCKDPQICGAKVLFSKTCSSAVTCAVNSCDCTPVFRDAKKAITCENTCSDKSTPLTCNVNVCSNAAVNCPSAVHCIVDPCNGCHPLYTDMLGAEVCASASTRQCINVLNFNFGAGQKVLGFGNVNGVCQAVKGASSGAVTFFADQKSCDRTCKCQDMGNVALGSCNQVLGFAVVNGKCQAVNGCVVIKTAIKISLHPNQKACDDACPAQVAVTKPVAAVNPIGNSIKPVVAPTSARVAGRCPGGQLQQASCPDMCRGAFVPTCAASRNKDLICITDSCGTCSAKWILHGVPFACPAQPAPCNPATTYGCCPSGLTPMTCTQYKCNVADCQNAVACDFDPCQNCSPVFIDGNGMVIPNYLCRSNDLASFQPCSATDTNCCASGYKPLKCPLVDKQTCPNITCSGVTASTCQSDSCNKCELMIFNSAGAKLNRTKCQYVPDTSQCSKVKCPASSNTPNCGPKPSQCAGVNLQCVKYQCSCSWNWVVVDIRYNPQQDGPWNGCSVALQASAPCVAPQNCPTDFACDAPDPVLTATMDPLILKQLVCKQAPCTCMPTLQPPPTNFRLPCTAQSNSSCCSDGLVPLECPADQAAWTCSNVQCNGVTAANCVADGCNQCGLKIFDAKNSLIDHKQCKVSLDSTIASMCSKVTCPVNPNMSCPPRPACYSSDWKLDCIVDPCTCRAIWIDEDTRAKPECADSLQPPCVAAADCPVNFGCSELDPATLANLGAEAASLICIQEACTCRPVFTTPALLPPGYRLPCKGGSCCADGKGPQVCDPAHARQICTRVNCGTRPVKDCLADGCNKCNVNFFDAASKQIPSAQCRLPLNTSAICPNVTCPAVTGTADGKCGAKPAACGSDWALRCVRDPCVCSRYVWVDEDTRFASVECTAAITPPCAAADACPKKGSWHCPNGVTDDNCIQETCTCRPIPKK